MSSTRWPGTAVVASVSAVLSACLLAVPAASGAADKPAATRPGVRERTASGRVVVRWRDAARAATRTGAARSLHAVVADRLGKLDVEVLRASDPAATVRRLRARADVLWAEPEGVRRHLAAAVRRPLAESGFAERAETRVEQAWTRDARMQGAGSEIAVIDDGVDPTWPDLSAAGKVLDGGDCTTAGSTCAPSGGLAPGQLDGLGWHGTRVATLAAGSHDSQGIAGAAPSATVVGYQVFEGDGSFEGSYARDSSIAKALLAAAARGVQVVNLSLGGPSETRLLHDALASARASNPGTVIVAAAGNDGSELPVYPAAGDGVLSVGASRSSGAGWVVADFSNRADADVLAPGVGVAVGGGETVSGTSFSAPQVSGIAAGLAAAGASGDEVRAALLAGARAPVARPYTATASGNGRVDALAAVEEVLGSAAFTSISVDDGSQIAGLVGRRTVEVLRASAPGGAGPATLSASAGTVLGSVVSVRTVPSGRTVNRTLATYAAPANSQRVRDARLDASFSGTRVASLPIRLLAATAGPEGAPSTNGATGVDRLVYGSATRAVRAVTLAEGQRLVIDVEQPDEACTPDLFGGLPICNDLLIWQPAVDGGTASASDEPAVVPMSQTDAIALYAGRSGRYVYGFEALSDLDDGVYRVRVRWPNPVSMRTSAEALNTRRGQRLRAAVGIAPGASGRFVVDVLRGGRLVRRLADGTRGPGRVALTWTGHSPAGANLPDGAYTLRARLVGAAGDVSGRAATVALDTRAPRLAALRPQYARFFPRTDGYRDTNALWFMPAEALRSGRVRVYDAHGRQVWSAPFGRVGAQVSGHVTFAGRGARGTRLPSGRYTFSVAMTDLAGNLAASGRVAFRLRR